MRPEFPLLLTYPNSLRAFLCHIANFTVSGDRKAVKLLLQRAAEISTKNFHQAEQDVIGKDCFPLPRAVGRSRSGVVEEFSYESQAECVFP